MSERMTIEQIAAMLREPSGATVMPDGRKFWNHCAECMSYGTVTGGTVANKVRTIECSACGGSWTVHAGDVERAREIVRAEE